MNQIRETTNQIQDLFELVFKSMIFITMIYLTAKALFGTVAANVGSILIGLATLFTIIVSKRVRDEILSFGKKKII